MLHLVIFSLLSPSAWAQLTPGTTDPNCTYMMGADLVFNQIAFACEDVSSPAVCMQFFGAGAPAPAYVADSNTTPDRPTGCFQDATPAPSQDIKDSAIQLCPKFCAFCCVTPAYNCPNAPYPQIDCSKVTQKQCKDPAWKEVIAANCPNVCGFCLNGGCTDAVDYCATQPTICSSAGLQDFVKANCQRTCGLCTAATTVGAAATTQAQAATTKASAPSTPCGDTNSNCANWVKNGFCSSTFYTTDQKRAYCGTSCGLCTGK